MSDQTELPNPTSNPELFEGILSRRVMAYIIDAIVIFAISGVIVLFSIVAGFLTFGLAWVIMPASVIFAILAYYSATLGSPARATMGMRFFDIILTPVSGTPLDGWKIILHPLIFWFTIWILFPLLLTGLFTPRRQLIQDLITGTLMVRKSPMASHWARQDDEYARY